MTPDTLGAIIVLMVIALSQARGAAIHAERMRGWTRGRFGRRSLVRHRT